MNERKIIDRKFLCDLAKEVGMTTLDLEAASVVFLSDPVRNIIPADL